MILFVKRSFHHVLHQAGKNRKTGATLLSAWLFSCAPTSSSLHAQSPERQCEAQYDLARDLFYKGDPRGALDHARKAIELDPDHAKALYFASTVYLYFCSGSLDLRSPDCHIEEAEALARRAQKADASFRDARNLLAQILILRGAHTEAIALLSPLVRDPGYAQVHLAWGNMGWAQVLSGQLEEGIVSLQNAVAEPRFCVGHYRLGIAYEKKGALQEAEAAFTTALTTPEPDCQNLQDALFGRARVRIRQGDASNAHADLLQCRQMATDSTTGKRCASLLQVQSSSLSAP